MTFSNLTLSLTSNNHLLCDYFILHLSQYAVRRQLVEEKVDAGDVQAEHDAGARHVRHQV
jgi:hypothetical protein